MGTLSKERLLRFKDISWRYFNWLSVLEDAGITEVQDLQGQYLLKCPFHADKRPSFRIRVHEHNFHCFSCNAFGTVVDLMFRTSGINISEVQFMEQVLRRNPAMQRELGFESLFIDSKTLDPGFVGRRKFSATNHIGSSMPISVFKKRVQDIDPSWRGLVMSLSMMQDGERLENIVERLKRVNGGSNAKGTRDSVEVPLMSLEDIIKLD